MFFKDVNNTLKFNKNIKSIVPLMMLGLLNACGDEGVKPETSEFHAQFAPQAQQLDLVNDLRFGDKFAPGVSVSTDGMVNAQANTTLADMDGFSTSAQFDITFNQAPDPASVHDSGKSQNIFLIPLKNIPGTADQPDIDNMALANFSIKNHNVIDAAKLQQQSFRANVISLDGKANVIRISPLAPLAPNTKYLVIMLDSIKDTEGAALAPSAEYLAAEQATDNADPLNKVVHTWQAFAKHVLPTLNKGEFTQQTKHIAYAYTFTTTRSPLDLLALASPKAALMAEGYSATQADNAQARTPLPADELPQPRTVGLIRHNLQFMDLFSPFIKQVGQLLDNLDPSTVAYVLNVPEDEVKGKLASVKSALGASKYVGLLFNKGMGFPAVTFSQGYIDLPYYLQAPKKDEQGHVTQASLNQFDQDQWAAEPGTNNNLNTRNTSPYPAQKTTERVPFLVTVPSTDKPATGWPVVIFQHGIFGDRSNSISTGIALASLCKTHRQGNKCFATIAMDLPLHGIAPTLDAMGFKVPSPFIGFGMHSLREQLAEQIKTNKDDAQRKELEKELAQVNTISERHFNVTRDDQGNVIPMQWDGINGPVGNSGSTFMNFGNFISQRDRMRQAVSDLLNLNASLKNIDIDGDGQPDFDTSQVYFVGHSLGGILGMPFVAVNNNPQVQKFNTELPKIRAAGLLTTGAAIPKLLENSPSFRPTIAKAFASMNLEFGSAALEQYLYRMQNVIDGADSINFAALLKQSNTPLYMAEVVGGAPVTDTDGYQVYSDNGEPQFAPGDQTIPNSADNKPTAPLDHGLAAPLAGTEPIIHLLGMTGVQGRDGDTGQRFTVTPQQANTPLRVVSRFNQGSHIMPVIALDNYKRLYADNKGLIDYAMKNGLGMSDIMTLAPYLPQAKDSLERSAGLFIEMSGEVSDFFSHNGESMQVQNAGYLSTKEPYQNVKPATKISSDEHAVRTCEAGTSCIIDDSDAAFAKYGSSWIEKTDRSTALNNNYAFAKDASDSAAWWFKVKQPGTYHISVRAPSDFAQSSSYFSANDATTGALYHVYSTLGESPNHLFNMVKGVNNPAPFDYPLMPDGEYISLGTYVFKDTNQSYKVTVHNRSAEKMLKGPLIVDAVKIEFISADVGTSKLHVEDNAGKYLQVSLNNNITAEKTRISAPSDIKEADFYRQRALSQINAIQQAAASGDLNPTEINQMKQQLVQIGNIYNQALDVEQMLQQAKVTITQLAIHPIGGSYPANAISQAALALGNIRSKVHQSTLDKAEVTQFISAINNVVEHFKTTFVAKTCSDKTLVCVTTSPDGTLMNYSSVGYKASNKGELKSKPYHQLGKSYMYYGTAGTKADWTIEVTESGKYHFQINSPGAFSSSDGYGSDKTVYTLIDQTDHSTVGRITLDTIKKFYGMADTGFDGQLTAGHKYSLEISGAYTYGGFWSSYDYGIAVDTVKATFVQ